MSSFVRLTDSRLRLVSGLVILLFGACFARAAYLSVWQAEFLRGRARQQHTQRVAAPAERGPIVDRNGQLLALTLEASDVFLRPAEFDPEGAALLAQALGIPVDLVRQRLSSSSPFVWLKRNVPRAEAEKVAALRLRGVGLQETRRRVYPMGSLAGQVLGTVDVDLRGLSGVEAAYDRFLRFSRGFGLVERDARGQRLRRGGEGGVSIRDGARLELTIDVNLQRATEAHLAEAVERTRALQGLAIVLDPRTGEVLALAHYPWFDPNDRSSAARANARIRAVTDPFEPGSTFKGFVVAAGLEHKVVSRDERLYCEGGRYRVGNRVVRDHDGYGWLSVADVMRHSSNICTAKIGERLGAERLYEALTRFGFDRITGIDLPGEKAYPLRPWSRWARIHLVTTSFGQGVAVTPMQLAAAYAALANGGTLVRPYVVRRVVADDGAVLFENQPHVVGQAVSPQVAAIVSELLEGVVQSGTGTKAQIQGLRVAGKTGTAQKVEIGTGRYSPRDRIASFAGYFPVEAPRFVVVVVIDTPRTMTYGGLVAAPVFHEIGEFVADQFGLRLAAAAPLPPPVLPSSSPSLRTAKWAGEAVFLGMPSFLGLSLREAFQHARRAGWEVEINGWGYVIAQDPPPGTLAAPERKLRLTLAPPLG
ncbi:putative peptidoglycan D,D-transpeptidase PenA [bacterium HR30]|nr:putative peptidoglycan D,D-transpeptidase PenA [bacterium HR30]